MLFQLFFVFGVKFLMDEEISKKLEGKKIAVIDDSATVRKNTAKLLFKHNVIVCEATDGLEGLACVWEQRPDLILLDIQMPRLEGYDVCRALRRHPDFNDLPIIFLSSNDGFFDKAKARTVGANTHLSKPYKNSVLIQTIEQYL